MGLPLTTCPINAGAGTVVAGAAAAVTLPAVVGSGYVVYQIECGYSDTPTAGSVTATDGVAMWAMPVTVGGAAIFPIARHFAAGSAVVVTLHAGGTALTHYLNVGARLWG
jgi:hypothetical protein